jgi:thiamine biosynthesis lipoprotein
MPSKSNRREFLKGEAMIGSIQDVIERFDQPGVHPVFPPVQASKTHLIQFARRAMACQFELFLRGDASAEEAELVIAALDLVDELEGQLTVYRDTSEISQLNRTAGLRPVTVEGRLFRLLQRAKEIHADTKGAFDITAGPLARAWGFFRREGRLPEEHELNEALRLVGSHRLYLDARRNEVTLERQRMEINLGGIGKGYALDRAGQLLQSAGVDQFLLHGGQSSVLAVGNRHVDEPSESGWSVGVRHPLRPDKRLVEIRVRDRGLGTSGTAKQFFHHRGKRYGHILDPRTGWPVEGLLSATAITASAADADALSTAFHVMGLEQTREFCAEHPEVAALLVLPSKAGAVEIQAFNLDADQWTCLDK